MAAVARAVMAASPVPINRLAVFQGQLPRRSTQRLWLGPPQAYAMLTGRTETTPTAAKPLAAGETECPGEVKHCHPWTFGLRL